MPIHDWARVDAGIFHHLHLKWIARLDDALNGGLLPPPFYSLAEPVIGDAVPDVMTLRVAGAARKESAGPTGLEREDDSAHPVGQTPGGVLVQELPPPDPYEFMTRRIVVKDELRGDEVVAVIELVSHGNKGSQPARDRFLDKTTELLRRGIHLVVIDIQPCAAPVPAGFHPLVCGVFGEAPPDLPRGRPLQAVSYEVMESRAIRSHVVPLAVGDPLPEMPLFLLPHRFVRLPLERTYTDAVNLLPQKFRAVLER